VTLRVSTRGLSVGIGLALLVGCGGGGGGYSGSNTTPPPPTPDFTLSASPSTLNIAPGSSGGVQVAVAAQNGFTGTVTVTPSGLPTGVTSAAVDIAAGGSGTLNFAVASLAAAGTFPISLQGKSSAISHTASFSLVVPASPPSPDFSLTVSPSTLTVVRGSSGNIQISITPKNGFTGSVAISTTNLPGGITVAPVSVPAGNAGTVTLDVAPATGPGPFTISLSGTSGTLSHSASVALKVPFGGGMNTLVPRTSGTNAFPSSAVPYVTKLIADIAPVRLAECGTASASHTIEVVYNPNQGYTNFDENSLVINVHLLPNPDLSGVDKNFFDNALMHESTHALQADILRIVNGVNRRGTIADTEGIAQACAYRVARSLALSGKRPESKSGGDLDVLWLDTFRRIDPEIIAAGGWITTSAPHNQPMLTLGEGIFLLAATQKDAAGDNGMVEHENALFAAETDATASLTADERVRIWDSLGFHLDGQTPGAWMPQEMIQDSDFTPFIGKPQLIAWPIDPQFPAQMMAQAFVIQSDNPSFQPIVQPITSGPLTISVKDAAGHVVLTKSADFSQTADIGGYTPNLQNLPQGTYTVFVDAMVNSTALEQHFVVANIPFDKTGLGGSDLTFPGQYLVAVDSAGNANGGILNVTRGHVVYSAPGVAIVKPDSSGTFDVTGPSGTKHTYTAPEPWARFIPVE
jgi:hypothetical protein